MRIPYFVQGALFGPAFIGLSLLLKVSCTTSAGDGCFIDHLAVPIFFPLIIIYKIFGESLVIAHELWFIVIFWGLLGLPVGLIFDLWAHKNENQMPNVK